jgi:hypothetical protein
MKKCYLNRILGIFLLLAVSSSCTSNLDFNQANTLVAKPIVVANLASVEVQASQFVIGGMEQPVLGDLQNFDVFRDAFFKDNLIRTDFYFEIVNTINRSYILDLVLLDANNVPVYPIRIAVPANTVAESPITKTVEFKNSDLDLLKRTVKIAFRITRTSANGSINSGTFKLRSSATAYLVIQ